MKTRFIVFILVFIAITVCLSISMPEFLAKNEFLIGFLNHELITIMVVILTVTATSAGHVNLTFNRFEEQFKLPNHFDVARREISSNIFGLVAAFGLTLLLLILKPQINSVTALSFIHSVALGFLALSMLLLIDTTLTMLNLRSPIAD